MERSISIPALLVEIVRCGKSAFRLSRKSFFFFKKNLFKGFLSELPRVVHRCLFKNAGRTLLAVDGGKLTAKVSVRGGPGAIRHSDGVLDGTRHFQTTAMTNPQIYPLFLGDTVRMSP